MRLSGLRFGGQSVENIERGPDHKTSFALNSIPDLLLMLRDFLVVLYFEVVEFIDLSLKYS